MIGANAEHDEREFNHFAAQVARYKTFESAPSAAHGANCRAAKFDTPASLHRSVITDTRNGSWLMAAGTVIDTRDVAPDGNLCALLTDYLAQGNSVLARCDGQFALVIYDATARHVIVASDPFGYFSIFYGARNGQVFVATSALAVAAQMGAQPDPLGVNCFLQTGKVFGEMTLWRGVKRLPAATALEFDGERTRSTPYWALTPDQALATLSLDEAIESSVHTVGSVLKRNLAREGRMWSDLTGGFDTRFLSFFLDRLGLPFKSDFVGPAEHEDVHIAQTIVNRFGWDYQNFQLPADWTQRCTALLKEALGRGDAHLNVLLLLRALWVHKQESAQYSTLLSGLGGEMWRGLLWWTERAALGASSTVHYDRQLWSVMHPVPQRVFANDTSAQVKSELLRQFTAVGEHEPDALNTLKLDRLWTYRETGHVGAWTSFGAGLLRVLPPLFSQDIVRHVISLDYRWKRDNRLVKSILEKYKPALANIEIEGRGPAIPLRATNFYRFLPSRVAQARKAARKFAQITFGKALLTNTRAEGYSRVEWRNAILNFAGERHLLELKTMRSAKLYDASALSNFFAHARTETFHEDEFLGRVLTVEMALDAVDASVE